VKNGKLDRRVKYTKMVLKKSLIKLLAQKDISQITVKELCEDADINRTTFYAHYSDQYDLKSKIEDELLENISSYLSDSMESGSDEVVDAVEKIFEYIRENAELCQMLLSDRGDINFQKRIMMLIYSGKIDTLISGGRIPGEYADYIRAYIITGCIGVVQKWLDDNMARPSRNMAKLLVALSMELPESFGAKK
jgi:AcrR family transcriptional regulator